MVTHPRGSDGSLKWHTRQTERCRGTNDGWNVRVDLRVQREYRCNNLHFVDESFWKQGADRPVNQARSQGFLFTGSPFTLEKPAGYPTRCVSFFLVVDGQGKKIPFPCDFL